MIQSFATLTMMMYTGYFSPFLSKLNNRMALFDEVIVLLSSYHLYCFTAWVGSPARRNEAGWSFLSLIALTVAVNFLIIITIVIKQVIQKIRRLYYRRVQRRWHKKAQLYELKQRLAADSVDNHDKVDTVMRHNHLSNDKMSKT